VWETQTVTDRVQVVAVVVSLILLATVVELVRRRKLIEEYSIVWIICAVAMLALAIWRDLLDAAARRLGIFYPPSLLLMFVTGLVFVALLWFSVILSRQRRQIDRLMEESAVLAAEIRELREERGGASASQEHVR
jgi:hypothetical protein